MQSAALEREWAREFLRGFAAWFYARKQSSPKLLKDFTFNISLLQRLDVTFSEITEITSSRLLDELGSKVLRKHLLLTTYLDEALNLGFSAEDRANASSNDLVRATVRECLHAPWGPLIVDFVSAIDSTTIAGRTRRMYVRTAAKLCKALALSPQQGLTMPMLKKYLHRHPGSRTNLMRFVGRGVARWDWDVSMPTKKDIVLLQDKQKVAADFKEKLDAIWATGVENVPLTALAGVLATAFAYRVMDFESLEWIAEEREGVLVLACGQHVLHIPDRMRDIARVWIQARRQSSVSTGSANTHPKVSTVWSVTNTDPRQAVSDVDVSDTTIRTKPKN